MAGQVSFSHSMKTWLVAASMESNKNQIAAKVCFPPNFSAFNGHFPCQPLLPGAFLLTAIRIIAAKILAIDLQPFYFENIKFKHAILPDQKIEITIRVCVDKETHILFFAVFSKSLLIATGSITCKSKQCLNHVSLPAVP